MPTLSPACFLRFHDYMCARSHIAQERARTRARARRHGAVRRRLDNAPRHATPYHAFTPRHAAPHRTARCCTTPHQYPTHGAMHRRLTSTALTRTAASGLHALPTCTHGRLSTQSMDDREGASLRSSATSAQYWSALVMRGICCMCVVMARLPVPVAYSFADSGRCTVDSV